MPFKGSLKPCVPRHFIASLTALLIYLFVVLENHSVSGNFQESYKSTKQMLSAAQDGQQSSAWAASTGNNTAASTKKNTWASLAAPSLTLRFNFGNPCLNAAEDAFYIYGGYGGVLQVPLGELWSYNFTSQVWTLVQPQCVSGEYLFCCSL